MSRCFRLLFVLATFGSLLSLNGCGPSDVEEQDAGETVEPASVDPDATPEPIKLE